MCGPRSWYKPFTYNGIAEVVVLSCRVAFNGDHDDEHLIGYSSEVKNREVSTYA